MLRWEEVAVTCNTALNGREGAASASGTEVIHVDGAGRLCRGAVLPTSDDPPRRVDGWPVWARLVLCFCAPVALCMCVWGHEATETGLAYAPVSQAHGHNHIVQCFACCTAA